MEQESAFLMVDGKRAVEIAELAVETASMADKNQDARREFFAKGSELSFNILIVIFYIAVTDVEVRECAVTEDGNIFAKK